MDLLCGPHQGWRRVGLLCACIPSWVMQGGPAMCISTGVTQDGPAMCISSWVRPGGPTMRISSSVTQGGLAVCICCSVPPLQSCHFLATGAWARATLLYISPVPASVELGQGWGACLCRYPKGNPNQEQGLIRAARRLASMTCWNADTQRKCGSGSTQLHVQAHRSAGIQISRSMSRHTDQRLSANPHLLDPSLALRRTPTCP